MKNWLRPRWYVQSDGRFEAGTAFPSSVLIAPTPDEPVICTNCGRECEDGWFGDGPYWCFPCDDADRLANPRKPLTGVRRLAQDLSISYDNLWYRYCARFGKRVPL